jgi:uncharacterized membrane protein
MAFLKPLLLKAIKVVLFLFLVTTLPFHIFANEEVPLDIDLDMDMVGIEENMEEGVEVEQDFEEEKEVFKGRILEQKEVDCGAMVQGGEFECFNYKIEILEGEYEGEVVETMPTWVGNEDDLFEEGSKVYVSQMTDIEGEQVWTVESYSRENALLILGIVFVVLIIAITGIRGVTATVGLAISFFILYFFAIPRINMGADLLLISIITIFILLCASTFITYGLNIKSFIAFISTFLGILIIAGIGYLVISWLNISGTGEEASVMLFDTTKGVVRLSWVFLLSIVIGALGVLDDVTIGQASSMLEIYDTNKSLSANELFSKTMNIGRDHIASMVNTLFIAYAGSSFSLVMLLSLNNPDFRILINTGFIVEEIARALVASIGLILVVPLTSFIASRIIVKVLK